MDKALPKMKQRLKVPRLIRNLRKRNLKRSKMLRRNLKRRHNPKNRMR
jgi:hypothetical protein